MKWTIHRDSTGWPWLESETHTIAKYGRENSDYLLFLKQPKSRVVLMRKVRADEVALALQGQWTP